MSDNLTSLADVPQNIEQFGFTMRKGIMGKWEWHVDVKVSGEIEGYANSYSGHSWFVANGKTLDEAIDGCIERATNLLDPL